MKICVLVKEVPDAAVEKRLDPSTGRMDRSGEKNLNPYDTQAIKMDVEADALPCERQAEYGYDTVQVKLPAVISVGDAINEPRYPSLKAIMGAKKKPLDALSASDAQIDSNKVGGEHSAAQWVAAKPPPAKAAGEIIEDEDTGETVEKIIAWLDERKLI